MRILVNWVQFQIVPYLLDFVWMLEIVLELIKKN